MIELDCILRDAVSVGVIEDSNYVYFLLKDNKVVYVGKTTDFSARVKAHKKNKYFDSFVVYSFLSIEQMDWEFLSNLCNYKPTYNKILPSGERFMYARNIKTELNMTHWEFRKFIKEHNLEPAFSLYDQHLYDLNEFEELLGDVEYE